MNKYLDIYQHNQGSQDAHHKQNGRNIVKEDIITSKNLEIDMHRPWHVQTTPRSPVSLRSKLPPIEINKGVRLRQNGMKPQYIQPKRV